jgi:hypothetical protein
LLLLLALGACAACSAPTLQVDAGGEDVGAEDGGDPDLERCGAIGGFTYFEYIFDGVPGDTGCVPSVAYVFTRQTTNRTAPAMKILITPYDTADTMPASDANMRGLPYPVCGAGLVFENTPLETGSTGLLVDREATSGDGYDPRAYAGFTYDSSPEDGLCAPDLGGTLIGGTWRVLTGGSVGDFVDIEARDATFEPFDGHTFELTRMRFHVEIVSLIEYP